MFKVNVISLFPDMIDNTMKYSIPGRALKENLWQLNSVQMRDFSDDKFSRVDDMPYGGGAGMLIKPEVIDNSLTSLGESAGKIIYMSPKGKPLTQEVAVDLSSQEKITIICGRYEGIDQRVIDKWSMDEISIGDYVLSGGEIAACALLDSVVRLLPNVLGAEESLDDESFTNGLLEYPHYTRPAVWNDMEVPEILRSGNHKAINDWRVKQSEEITKSRRLDLWKKYVKVNNN